MGRTKPNFEAGTKKHVSASATFKHVEIPKLSRSKLPKKSKNSEKFLLKHKQEPKPDGPLAAAFTASIENSRSELTAKAEAFLDATREELTQRIASSNDLFGEKIQALKHSDEVLRRPLGQDMLCFVSKDGRPAGTQTLGVRMRKFRKIVAAEEHELEVLRQQWTEVQQSINNLASEMIGLNAWEQLLQDPLHLPPDYVLPHYKAVVDEAEKEKNRLAEKIVQVSEQAVTKMEEGEEEMSLLQQKQMASLLSLMETELEGI